MQVITDDEMMQFFSVSFSPHLFILTLLNDFQNVFHLNLTFDTFFGPILEGLTDHS